MEYLFEVGDLVRIKVGPRLGEIGKIVERSSDAQLLYRVEFPRNEVIAFFFQDEMEEDIMPCPRCVFSRRLSEPQRTKEGWARECPIHGRFYLSILSS